MQSSGGSASLIGMMVGNASSLSGGVEGMSGVGWRAAQGSFSLNAVTPPAKEAKVMGKQPSGLFYLKPRPQDL